MDLGPFHRVQQEKVIEGQRLLANTGRGLLRRAEPDLYEALGDAPDETFLEPLLFAWFNASKAGKPKVELAQVLLGYVDTELWPEAIEVYSDARGCVYLPRIGYFLTAVKDRTLVLRCDGAARRFALEDGGAPVDFRFEELLLVPGTSIEVSRYPHPLYEVLLSDPSGKGRVVEFKEQAHRYVGFISRALAVIQEQQPEFHRELVRTVRHLVVFHSAELNSCATLGAHGAAFLNVSEGDDEVFFMDDLAHQCGHVVFNAFTAARKAYFTVDPEAEVTSLTGRHDHRSVYTAFHGAYTEFVMIACLLAAHERRVFSGRQAHELLGRLSSIFQKSQVDLKNLSHPGLFTPQGQFLYDTFRDFWADVARRHPELLRFDLSNQGYNFQYARFLERNPAGAAATGAA